MKVVEVANQKGGVGKTTLTRHFLFHAVEKGLRVLVVDLDPQANLTKTMLNLSMQQVGGSEMPSPVPACGAHLLFQDTDALDPMEICEGVSLIAGTPELTDALTMPLDQVANVPVLLRKLGHHFDICLVDTPPTMSNLTFAGLMSADYVVMPCDIDQDATDGLTALFHNINVTRQHWNPGLQVLGVLPNKVNRRRNYDVNNLQALREQLGSVVLTSELTERSATKLAKLHPVWKNPRGDSDRRAAAEMRAACEEVFVRMGM
ncbi:ParA family protein [Ralstonia pseudosolanacearum]|jgi:chromosome partitioning protein|uniref:ParA family protein n=1 Tax=Ralstonia pseudosolanacearum TaxID=1310165 RepID=A0A454TM56_9RALS|nr:ParA family protein [Ralstonia pseudosolanacearum]RNM03223.1 ParA family protein [Ralstonia pseudosolanacearum]